MTVPVVVFPNPLRMMLTLLRAHPQLPARLTPAEDHVVATLPDKFPEGWPYVQDRKSVV